VLIVSLARPEILDERPGWAGNKLNAASVLLDPLSAEESSELIRGVTTTVELAPQTLDRITAAAQGNPLFLEQILAMLDQGENGAGEICVPPAIQALLSARLERLEPDQRRVLEHASTRSELHERHAYWLEQTLGDHDGEADELLGYHLEQAAAYRRELGDSAGAEGLAAAASAHLGAGGRRPLASGDLPAAANLLGRAADIIPADQPQRLAVRLECIPVRAMGRHPRRRHGRRRPERPPRPPCHPRHAQRQELPPANTHRPHRQPRRGLIAAPSPTAPPPRPGPTPWCTFQLPIPAHFPITLTCLRREVCRPARVPQPGSS
jgi:hypothetical protein